MPTDAKPAPAGRRWLIFCILAAAYILVYFHRMSPTVVATDLMRDLGAGATLTGLLSSAYFYPYALMQLPAGLLADSWGPRKTITGFFALSGLAAVGFGLAESPMQAFIARLMVGIGVAMVFVCTLKILTHWFRREQFARMTGLLMALGGVGVWTATQPLAALSAAVGWRMSFVIIGAGTLVWGAVIWALVRNRPEDMGYAPVEDSAAGPQGPPPGGLWAGVRTVLASGRFWALGVWFFCACGVFFSFGGLWGGPFLEQVYGLDKAARGNVLSMLALAMIIMSPVLSWLSDSVLRSRKRLLVGSSALLLALCLLLALWPAGLGLGGLYAWCFLMSVSASAIVAVGFTTGKELFPVAMAGTSVGLVNLFPFLGGAVMQPLLGWLLERQGGPMGPYTAAQYGQAFWLFVASAVVALAASLLLRETHPARQA